MADEIRALVLQHVEWEGAGIIGSNLRAAKARLNVVKLHQNDSIPFEKLEQRVYDVVVALGSPSTAYLPETNPYHELEIQLYRLIRKSKIPSFNVCYSMQMFCISHGGTVTPNPLGKEVGFFDVQLTPDGRRDPLLKSVRNFRTLQWHGDIVSKLPVGAIPLARSEKTTHQIVVVDKMHYLFQGDGQAATPSMLESWFKHDGAWALQGSGARKKLVIQEVKERRAYFRSVYRRIFENFLRNATGNASESR